MKNKNLIHAITLIKKKFKLGDFVLIDDYQEIIITKIIGIKYTKCKDGYSIQYLTDFGLYPEINIEYYNNQI